MKKLRRKRRLGLVGQLFIGLLVIIATGLFSFILYGWIAANPILQTKASAIQLAKSKAGLVKAETYAVVTTDVTVYSVTGLDTNGQTVAVLIPKDSGSTIEQVALKNGVAADKIPHSSGSSIMLGLYKDKPIWEVNSSKGFQIYDFTSGKMIANFMN